MQDIWSHLLLIFGVAAHLVTASLMQAVATTSPTPTILVTIPTIPYLSVTYDYKVVAPTPGSVGLLDGLPIRILNDTIKEPNPVLADTADADTHGLYQPWNTSYPGPIHDGDWAKYLEIWDPVWWSTNLDSLRQTSCTCSADDFYTNPQAQLAAYMNFEFYSHQLGNTYSFDWACGPVQSSMSISERKTSREKKSEHCWTMAGGEFTGNAKGGAENMHDWFCDEKEELCLKPWRDGKRSLKFHGHKRNYDRDGVHTWAEVQEVVQDVCGPICKDTFLMNYDDFSHHNPSFVTTFYPPKPIDLTIVGD